MVDIKRFSKCGNILLKSNFHKDDTKKDGVYPNLAGIRNKKYSISKIKRIKVLFL